MKSLLPIIAKKAPSVSQKIGRTVLQTKKQSPHIFFAAGLVGSVASTVLACRATLKLSDTLDEIQHDLSNIKEAHNDHKDPSYPRKSSDEEVAKDTVYVYAKAAGKLGRLYGPSVAVGVVSIGCLTGAHVNLSRRNAALMAAYTTLQASYDNYRARVNEEFGPDKEIDLYHAKVGDKESESSSDVTPLVDSGQWSPYARIFDEQSRYFDKNADYNRLHLNTQQNWANEMLRARGHLFLNEVYDMLGFDHTKEGAVVGWLIGGDGDEYVEFGHYEAIDFQQGIEPRVVLDFNVDGVIYDKI